LIENYSEVKRKKSYGEMWNDRLTRALTSVTLSYQINYAYLYSLLLKTYTIIKYLIDRNFNI